MHDVQTSVAERADHHPLDLRSLSPNGTLSSLAPISLLISHSHYSHRIIVSGSLPHTNASTHLHTNTLCRVVTHFISPHHEASTSTSIYVLLMAVALIAPFVTARGSSTALTVSQHPHLHLLEKSSLSPEVKRGEDYDRATKSYGGELEGCIHGKSEEPCERVKSLVRE